MAANLSESMGENNVRTQAFPETTVLWTFTTINIHGQVCLSVIFAHVFNLCRVLNSFLMGFEVLFVHVELRVCRSTFFCGIWKRTAGQMDFSWYFWEHLCGHLQHGYVEPKINQWMERPREHIHWPISRLICSASLRWRQSLSNNMFCGPMRTTE